MGRTSYAFDIFRISKNLPGACLYREAASWNLLKTDQSEPRLCEARPKCTGLHFSPIADIRFSPPPPRSRAPPPRSMVQTGTIKVSREDFGVTAGSNLKLCFPFSAFSQQVVATVCRADQETEFPTPECIPTALR